jgi:peroxiredoxin
MLKAGKTAPAFQLQDDDGNATSLEDWLSDGPVLLAFFKASCPTCQYTLPYLSRLSQETGVPVLGISQDDAETTRDFKAAYRLPFQTVLDTAETGYAVSNAYKITHVPSLFLLEPDGVISLSESGFSRSALESIAQRFGGAVFRQGEQVPEFRPG